MATLSHALSLLIFTTLIPHSFGQTKTLRLMNNCGYTVWPGINGLSASNNNSGFALLEGESKEVFVPPDWNGQLWGRSLCSTNKSTGIFYCQTGDCATGSVQCAESFVNPVTLADFTLGGDDNIDYYDVSLVNGYNLPLMVAPLVESGATCTATGCVFDLKGSCPAVLRMSSKAPNDNSSIIGCRDPCTVFGTEQYCCLKTPNCPPSNFSKIFVKGLPKVIPTYEYPTLFRKERVYQLINLRGYSLYSQLVLEWNPLSLVMLTLSPPYGCGPGPVMDFTIFKRSCPRAFSYAYDDAYYFYIHLRYLQGVVV